MNPAEARDKNSLHRVKMFNAKDHFEADIARKKWDRIKIICTQPFNKVFYFIFHNFFVKLFVLFRIYHTAFRLFESLMLTMTKEKTR
jgi:hypothetical protein